MVIKTYNKLYSKDSSGNVRVWWMEQENDKYRANSGVVDGAIVTSAWTTCKPKNTGKKNATTGTEQAAAEIESKYTKRLKKGYYDNINDINSTLAFIEPILAKKYENYKKNVTFIDREWGAQTKFNGVCLIASKIGLRTRHGEPFYTLKHIEESLAPFFAQYPNAVLHGEAFNNDLRQELNEIIKLCRKSVNATSEDIAKAEQKIRFYVYDGYNADVGLDESIPYQKRKNWIDKNVIGTYKYCVEVKTHIIESQSQLDTMFIDAIACGDEGLILRKLLMPYEHKRSKNLLKYKPLDSDEMVILNIVDGKGNWSGKAKNITVKMKNGKVFDATFKGTMEDATICLNKKSKWIGKTVTIEYIGLTGLGCPQYAQFNYKNCNRMD
jgi:DNA ligase 1